MAELHLPAIATGILSHTYNSSSSDDSKFCVYALSSSGISIKSLQTICADVTKEYVKTIIGDDTVEDYHEFLSPISSTFASIQECLDHHFNALDAYLLEESEGKDISTVGVGPARHIPIYPYGILVYSDAAWATAGATLVHCDDICKSWYIGSLALDPEDIGIELTSLRFGDENFGDMACKRGVRVPQNDPQIEPHYADTVVDETGSWTRNGPMFAVFSTGMHRARPVLAWLDQGYEDVPFGHSEVDMFGPRQPYTDGGGWEDVREQYLKAVKEDRKGQNRHMRGGACIKCRPLHRSLFVDVDNPDPRENGVLVCRMDWDGKMEGRSDEELREIGKSVRIETKRVGVAFALPVLRAMAKEEVGDDTSQEKTG